MAPAKFQIYVDQSIRQPEEPQHVKPKPITKNESTNASDEPARYKPEILPPNCRFYFDERKIYPVTGGEYSFEELNLAAWKKRQRQLAEEQEMEDLERENQYLLDQYHQLTELVNQRKQPEPTALPPATEEMENMSLYGSNEVLTVIQDLWRKPLPRHENNSFVQETLREIVCLERALDDYNKVENRI